MDQRLMAEVNLRLQHLHSDGTWNTLERRPQHHDPADHDPERAWAEGQLFACPSCDEQVIVRSPSGEERD
jgi:hypothetical protein